MSVIQVAGVDVHIEGEGDDMLVMLHGWPDTHRLWDSLVEALKPRHRCVRFTQPGFAPGSPRHAYTIDELMAIYLDIVDLVSPGRPVTLVLHDWGCIFGYEFAMRHPERVSRIVGVDIGDTKSLRKVLGAREVMAVLAYQVWLALAWMFGGAFGDWMNRAMARKARCPSDPAAMHSGMCYPYFLTWFGGARSYGRATQRFTPHVPMLFVYGRRKQVRFHAKAWADAVAARPGSSVVGFDTGHWVMLEDPARFNDVVGAWLSAARDGAQLSATIEETA